MQHATLKAGFVRSAALVVATLAPLTGCGGGEQGRVTGQVVRSTGAPLSGVSVIARSDESGKTSYGTTDGEGHFELSTITAGDGVPPGRYRVVIMEPRGATEGTRPVTIAAKYGDPAKSGLSFTLVAGEDKTFDVTVDPP
jgi:hypothetical protein